MQIQKLRTHAYISHAKYTPRTVATSLFIRRNFLNVIKVITLIITHKTKARKKVFAPKKRGNHRYPSKTVKTYSVISFSLRKTHLVESIISSVKPKAI